MALSALVEQHELFQRMLNQLNALFDPGVELDDSDPALYMYSLRVKKGKDVRQAMSIITQSGLLPRDAIDAISNYMSEESSTSLFSWEDLGVSENSLIIIDVVIEEYDDEPYYAICIDKTF